MPRFLALILSSELHLNTLRCSIGDVDRKSLYIAKSVRGCYRGIDYCQPKL